MFEEEVEQNKCVYGADVHYWYVFECKVKGEPVLDKREAKSMGWYSPAEIKNLKLEPVWQYWLRKMRILA